MTPAGSKPRIGAREIAPAWRRWFAAVTVWLGLTLPQFSDVEGLQTAEEARSIGVGTVRCEAGYGDRGLEQLVVDLLEVR